MIRTLPAAAAECPRRMVTTLALVIAAALVAPAAAAAQETRGKAIYDKWCAGCHGEDGAGVGDASQFMHPPPRDFTRALYQIRTTASGELPTDADLQRMIDDGMPGTAMPGWKSKLSSADRDAVIAYIKSFSRFFDGAAPAPMSFSRGPGVSNEGLAEGRRVWEQLECSECHGPAGRGDGTSAPTLTDDWDFPIRAADLSEPWLFNGGGTVDEIYRRLRTGLDGTPMPSFSDIIEAGLITDEQLWRVAQYVRSLGPEQSPPRVRDVVRAFRLEGGVPITPDDSTWAAVQSFYIPLVGQIIVKPRWFAPRVDGVWVRAVHDGTTLAVKFTWNDPNRSPDPGWQEWVGKMARSMTDADGAEPTHQGPDRLHVQFPIRLTDGMERPFFLSGDRRNPVYVWRWSSAPDRVEEGRATGPGTFTAASTDVGHASRFDAGQWELVLTRALVPADTTAALAFAEGRAIPMALFAADGSNLEGDVRGSVSAWYAIYLDVPTPTSAYVTPLVAMLLTAGLGVMVVWRAQQRGRSAA